MYVIKDVTTDEKNFANSTTISAEDATVIAKKKNRSEYMGMFQCSLEDDPIVARNLIIGNLFTSQIMSHCFN